MLEWICGRLPELAQSEMTTALGRDYHRQGGSLTLSDDKARLEASKDGSSGC